jgi:Double-GTPase 2
MATPADPIPPVPPQTAAPEAADVYVNLPSGKPLKEDGASNLLRAHAAPIILLAGAAKSGKTTLLASLHDSFQRKPFAGYLAAGSRTLMGFEERCFDSRAASGADEATTVRTRPAEGLLFYHLKLRNEDLKTAIQHVLLADMSGEHYSGALDSATEMHSLTIITRADHFVHLVDGGKLVSKELSALTQSNAMMLMRRCFEEGMLEPDAKVDILLSKWDIALRRCGEENAQETLKQQRDTFDTAFGSRVARLRVTPVAARPHYRSTLQPAYGLSELFRSWVDEPPRRSKPQMRLLRLAPMNNRFDAFALREAPELFEGDHDA